MLIWPNSSIFKPRRSLPSMQINKKVVIAEDHTILRAGLKALLSSQENIDVVGEAGDGREAIRIADKLVPDLLLIDLLKV